MPHRTTSTVRHGVAIICLLALIMLPMTASAQSLGEVLTEHNQHRIDTNTTGMLVLMGWAAGNIAAGTAGYFLSEDPRWRAFHQMNALWNTVNAAIGAFGYFGTVGQDPASFGLAETLRESYSMEKILALNTGLDVAYMAAGWALWERGIRKDDARWRGWGQSVILQGAFLFSFDLVLWLLNSDLNEKLLVQIEKYGEQGAKLSIGFAF